MDVLIGPSKLVDLKRGNLNSGQKYFLFAEKSTPKLSPEILHADASGHSWQASGPAQPAAAACQDTKIRQNQIKSGNIWLNQVQRASHHLKHRGSDYLPWYSPPAASQGQWPLPPPASCYKVHQTWPNFQETFCWQPGAHLKRDVFKRSHLLKQNFVLDI